MEYYVISNDVNDIQYIKRFENPSEARSWVTNHLDLSLNWQYETLGVLLDWGLVKHIELF